MILKRALAAALLLATCTAWAQDNNTRYIDGHVTLALRDSPSSDGTLITFLETGQQLTLLETMGPQSYARVRMPDGREGWIAARFLTEDEPPARRLAQANAELEAERERTASLEREVGALEERLSRAAPALQLADENAELEARLAEREAELERSLATYNEERARQRTLMTGGLLAGGGVLLGLILPWLARSRKRNGYGGL